MKNTNPELRAKHPLLRVLTAEAARRGDSLTALATAMGVTYRRLAQWRSGEADIAHASDRVMRACAAYLGVPGVVVLTLSGRISLDLLLTPNRESEALRLHRDMRTLLNNPKCAGLAPEELLSTHPSVQKFVGYLVSEVEERTSDIGVAWRWLEGIADAGDTPPGHLTPGSSGAPK